MPTSPINLAERSKTLDHRLQAQLKRCQSLDGEAQALTRDRKSVDNMTRGLFVSDLIQEAQSKLVECQLVAAGLANHGELAAAHLAISERWVTSAIDLLNRAQMVLDFQQDIWGKALPTGDLWDK